VSDETTAFIYRAEGGQREGERSLVLWSWREEVSSKRCSYRTTRYHVREDSVYPFLSIDLRNTVSTHFCFD